MNQRSRTYFFFAFQEIHKNSALSGSRLTLVPWEELPGGLEWILRWILDLQLASAAREETDSS